jgi:hypothetical protein
MVAERSHWISHRDLAAVVRDVLSHGQSFRFRAHGLSMLPFIRPGDLLTIQSLGGRAPRVGDVILYQVAGERLAAHRVLRGMTAGCRLSGRCSKEICRREVECCKGFDNVPRRLRSRGWLTAANPHSQLRIATCSNQDHTASSSSTEQDGMLHVRGDRLWASLELVRPRQLLGQVIAIERDGRAHQLTGARHRLVALAWIGLRPFVRAARSRLGKMKQCVAGRCRARGESPLP